MSRFIRFLIGCLVLFGPLLGIVPAAQAAPGAQVTLSGHLSVDYPSTTVQLKICFTGYIDAHCTTADAQGDYTTTLYATTTAADSPVEYGVTLEGTDGQFNFKSTGLAIHPSQNTTLDLQLQTQAVTVTVHDYFSHPVAGAPTEVVNMPGVLLPEGTVSNLTYSGTGLNITEQNNGATSIDTPTTNSQGVAVARTAKHLGYRTTVQPPAGSYYMQTSPYPTTEQLTATALDITMLYARSLDADQPTPNNTNGTSTTLTWQPVSGAASYNVYRLYQAADATTLGQFIGTTTGTSYTDQTLAAEGNYAYQIVAFDFLGQPMAFTGNPSVTVDRTAPAVVSWSLTPNPVVISGQTTLTVRLKDVGPSGASSSGFSRAEYVLGTDAPVEITGLTGNNDDLTATAAITAPATYNAYPMTVRLYDYAGNVSQIQTSLAVYDPNSGSAAGQGDIIPGSATSNAGDNLPGLDHATMASIAFSIKNQGGSGGKQTFDYKVGDCKKFTGTPNCFELASTGLQGVIITGALHDHAMFVGSATITRNGQADPASYPFKVTVLDGAATNQPDHFLIQVYTPGSDPLTASTPLYQGSGDVLRVPGHMGRIVVQP
jgi:hypothetical protein